VRSAARRAKQISRYRHQRATIEPDASNDAPDHDSAEGPENIEVHVHVHRGAGGAPKRANAPVRTELTGVLFDWTGHYDRVCQRPQEQKLAGLARFKTCHGCYKPVSLFAQRCAWCSTPRSRRPLRTMIAMGALLTVGVAFGVFVHLFGNGSIAERVTIAPLGHWSSGE
jgi:hypothetical protein